MVRNAVRPLLLVAGFLGAGKTSFLRQLVPILIQKGLRPRIILNDIENARIDAATLGDLEAQLTPLAGSCLCCETQDALLEVLRAESSSDYDVVLLETNGTADTAVLLELLAEADGLPHLGSPLQITIVDAVRFGQRGWMNAIEREQIRTSSHLRVGKTDLVDESRHTVVRSAIASWVPTARFVDVSALADELVARTTGWTEDDTSSSEPPGDSVRVNAAIRSRTPSAAQNAHHHSFLSCQIPLPFPVDLLLFEGWLRALPPQIIRAKGIVVLRDPPGEKRSFQWVSGEGEVSPCQLQDPETLTPVAVFVGSGLDVADLKHRIAHLATVSDPRFQLGV